MPNAPTMVMDPTSVSDIVYPSSYLAESRQAEIYVVHTTFFVLSMAAVAARFVTATRVAKRRLAVHDWLALAAGVATVGVYTCSMLWLHFGLGRHEAWALAQDRRNVRRFLQAIMANELLYTTTLACARLSLVAFYYRIFGVTRMRYWLHFLVGFIVAWALYSYIPSIFACWPISDFWDRKGDMRKCINLYAFYTAVAIGSIFTDFLLLALPLPYVWSLRTTLGRRVLTALLFVFGGMNCFITLIRVFVVLGVDMSDSTYNTVELMIWTGMEVYSATLCCCFPALPPLFRDLCQRCGLKSLFSNSGSSGKNLSGSSGDSSSPDFKSIGRWTSRPKKALTDTITFSEFDDETTYTSTKLDHTSSSPRNSTPLDRTRVL